jgi:DNA-binding protein HU-beta
MIKKTKENVGVVPLTLKEEESVEGIKKEKVKKEKVKKDLNYSDLVALVAKDTNINKKGVRLILDSFVNQLKQNLLQKQNIVLQSFMFLKWKTYKAVTSRNLQTGEKVIIPARDKVKVKLSKKFLKDT